MEISSPQTFHTHTHTYGSSGELKPFRFVFIGLIGIFLSGCASYKVDYSLKDVPHLSGGYFANYDLTVKEFEDVRTPFEQNRIQDPLGPGPKKIVKDGKTWFYNSENHYKSHVVAPWVTQMIVKHLDASMLFERVKFYDGRVPQKGFLLEGKIKKFEAFKERSMGAETAKYFGLAGGLAILGMRAEYTAVTILTEVTLTDVRNSKLLLQETFEGKVEGTDMADLYGWTVYYRASLSLKEAVNKLIGSLEQVGRNYRTA